MPRYFIKLAFKGTNYHGWQVQDNAISVQAVLDRSLSLLVRETIHTLGAGRTDTGVHAKEFYAHFDTIHPFVFDAKFIGRLNSFLPNDIVVYAVFPVHEKAHARFDAISRTYEYHIHLRKDPFLEEFSTYVYKSLDIEKMNEAAQLLLEYKDFKCFSKSRTQVNNYNCNLDFAQWKQQEYKLLFTIQANRFLRNMVRAIVGTLLEVGEGAISLEDFKKIVERGDRSYAGESVPAHGLVLTNIRYHETILQK